jgi:hypothetical protein
LGDGLKRLVLMLVQHTAAAGRARGPQLVLSAA